MFKIDQTEITNGAQILRRGGLVVFPTETVYGLGANAADESAVSRIFSVKGRPPTNPLIIHVTGIDAAAALGDIDPLARKLAERFWPGPLTIVFRRRDDAGLAPAATAGFATVAIRAPAHPIARALLQAAGCPVAAPSANVSGRVSPTRAAHVRAQLGATVDLIIDGGPCTIGLESTVLDLSRDTPAILRPGGVSQEQLEAIAGPLAPPTDEAKQHSPGTLARHYAPRAQLRLNASEARPGEAYLAFGPAAQASPGFSRNLSPTGNIAEAAANLFAMLVELDELNAEIVAIAPIPDHGLGVAINDRLRRAARR